MARQKSAEVNKDAGSQVEARALVDLAEHGVKSGDLVTAAPEEMARLSLGGFVDTHPEAVAYAKANA